MRVLLVLLMLPLFVQAAEHDHSAASETSVHDHAAMTAGPALDLAIHDHGGEADSLLMVDRIERQQREGEDQWQWQGSYWYGGAIDKWWLKSEGSWLDRLHTVDTSDTQLLYSHAVTPFWDLQGGVRYSEDNGVSHNWAVLGVQGLAPYWFHVDAALFAGDGGLWQGKLETSYQLRLTQQWILEPRLQLHYAFNDDPRAAIRQGVFDSNVGLRLRYEIMREFAPYVGIEHDFGGQHQADQARFVVGLRFWY